MRISSSRIGALMALALLASACTSDSNADPGFGSVAVDTSSVTVDEDQSDTPVDTSDEVPAIESDLEAGWEQQALDAVVNYETVWQECIAEIESCDGESVFAETAVDNAYEGVLGNLERFRDQGAKLRPGTPPEETMLLVRATEVPTEEITESTIGISIVACYVDDGILYRPANEDGPERVLNDEVLVQIREYFVVGDELDSLRVMLAYQPDDNEGESECELL